MERIGTLLTSFLPRIRNVLSIHDELLDEENSFLIRLDGNTEKIVFYS